MADNEFKGKNIVTEVASLDDGIPLTPTTKMYVDHELTFRQIPLSRLYDWIKGQLTKIVYPVGSVYMTFDSGNPTDIFGGTWEKIEGEFLLGSSDDYQVGNHGGESEHILAENELPYVTGSFDIRHWGGPTVGNIAMSPTGKFSMTTVTHSGAITTAAGPTNYKGLQRIRYSFGGGNAHNNMPPYVVVNIWKRTA